MRLWPFSRLLLFATIWSCSNSNNSTKVTNGQVLDSSQLKEFDVYKFENDSIIQYAFIHYLTPRRIVFELQTTNKKNQETCNLSDTATRGEIDNAAGYTDELNNDEMYGAFEFSFDRGEVHTYIGIEPSRGKRLSVQTGLDSLCDPSCPLHSVGTLRLLKLSQVKQAAPDIPKY